MATSSTWPQLRHFRSRSWGILLGICLISLSGCQVTNKTGMYRGYVDWRAFWQPRFYFERDRLRNRTVHHKKLREKIRDEAYFINWDDRFYIDPRSQAQRTLPTKEGFIPGNPASKSLPVEGTTDTPAYTPPFDPPTVPTYPEIPPDFPTRSPDRLEPDGNRASPDGTEGPPLSPSRNIPEPLPQPKEDSVADRRGMFDEEEDEADDPELMDEEDFESDNEPLPRQPPATRAAQSKVAPRTIWTRFWKRSETK